MPVTYDQPMVATLQVKLANGKTWEAKPEDMKKFGYVNALDAYMIFNDHLTKVLTEEGLLPTQDLTDSALNPLRYLVELSICHPDILKDCDISEVNAQIAEIERAANDEETR